MLPLLFAGQPVSAQLLRPYFVTPDFGNWQPEYNNWEYSRWDKFYTPHDFNGTQPRNRNYPDIAAPNGYAVKLVGSDSVGPLGDVSESPAGSGNYVYVGPFNGLYVWRDQSHAEATASGYTGQLPTDPNPSLPRTIFHADNPSIRQHSTGAFIISPGFTGNIYSFSTLVSYTLEDSLSYNPGSVVFQFQNQGRDVDMNSIRLRYNNGTSMVEIPATDTIIEREAFASHAGFTFTTRAAAEWDVSSLGINSYEIVWKAAGTSCSIQEVLLDTADAYVRDKGLPAKRIFLGTGGSNWDQGINWQDVAGNQSSPKDNANIVLSGGTSLTVGNTTRKVSLLETNLPGSFTVEGNSPIELGTGFHSAASAAPQTINFNVPVQMTAFNYFDVGANVTVSLNKQFSGNTGFEKRGAGDLLLGTNNTFTGALFVSGGRLTVAGTNSYGGDEAELDVTYIYLGEIVLESAGTLGVSGVKVSIGSTPYEVVGETNPSRLIVKGQRDFNRPVEFTGGFNPKTLSFTNTGTGATCSSVVTLHDGTELGMFGTESPTGNLSLDTPLAGDKVTFTGTFSGGATIGGEPQTHAVRKTGLGQLVFSGGNKTYKHQTHVEAGSLVLQSGTALSGGNAVKVNAGATFTANGPVTLTASKLTVDGVLDGSGAIVRSGAVVIGGSGQISKPLTIDQGTTLAPGNSVGTLSLTGAQTWGTTGRLQVEIIDAESASGHDKVQIDGALALTATKANPFVIELKSLNYGAAAGPVQNFNPYGNYSWKIATATGGITGFNAAAFNIVTTGFTSTLAGTFSVTQQGQDLLLNYTRTSTSATPYATWASSLPADLRGENQDADNDGISNLVEFATGTSGTTPTTGNGVLRIRREVAGQSSLEFSIAEPFRPGVTAKLLSSETMLPGSWQAVATKPGVAAWQGSGVVTEGTAASGRRPVSVVVPDAPDGKPKFFRLQFKNEE